MMEPLMSPAEVEDFFALGLSIDADLVPEADFVRAIAEHRVQQAYSWSSMGTAETYWTRASSSLRDRSEAFVLPPGETAFETANEHYLDDRDVDGVLWEPHRREQDHRLAANLPEARVSEAIAECMRVHAVLDAKFARGDKPPPSPSTIDEAVRHVMSRIERFDRMTLRKRRLRNALIRALVAIAWSRPWTPVDVDVYWRKR